MYVYNFSHFGTAAAWHARTNLWQFKIHGESVGGMRLEAKAGDCLRFVGMDVKNGIKFGDLQQVAYFFIEV